MVDETADLRLGLPVADVGILQERQRLLKSLLSLGGLLRGQLDPALCLGALEVDALLLSTEHGLVDAVSVEELQELLLLALEILKPSLMTRGFTLGCCELLRGVVADGFTNRSQLARSEPNLGVVVLDCFLYAADEHMAAIAIAVSALVT